MRKVKDNRARGAMECRHASDTNLDYYPTPQWATRALVEWIEQFVGKDAKTWLKTRSVWEPAAGAGHMIDVLSDSFGLTRATDIEDYGRRFELRDFIAGDGKDFGKADFVITNPPFSLAQDFILRGMQVSDFMVCMLARLSLLETHRRYNSIFKKYPPASVLVFSDRLGFVKGKVAKGAPGSTAFAWFVWIRPFETPYPTRLEWIPPGTKARLERESDYIEGNEYLANTRQVVLW